MDKGMEEAMEKFFVIWVTYAKKRDIESMLENEISSYIKEYTSELTKFLGVDELE